MPRSHVGDREARADGEGGELIERIAARAPVRQLLLVELLGHPRVPFAGYRPDHRAGIEFAAMDAHRAAEAAADLERGLNDGVASRRGTTGSKYVTFRGGLRWAIPFLLVRSGREISVLYGMPLPGSSGRPHRKTGGNGHATAMFSDLMTVLGSAPELAEVVNQSLAHGGWQVVPLSRN